MTMKPVTMKTDRRRADALQRRIAAYAAAAAAFAGSAGSASAEVTSVAPAVLGNVFPPAPLQIDLNGDGLNDLSFFVTGGTTREVQGLYPSGAQGQAAIAVLTSIPSFAVLFTPGQSIGSSQQLNSGIRFGYSFSGNFSNPWAGTTADKTGYLGGQFFDSVNAQPHFFWLKVRLSHGQGGAGVSEILDGAFESTPGAAIQAGAQPPVAASGGGSSHHGCQASPDGGSPAPSILALLALGAVGVTRLRRERAPA